MHSKEKNRRYRKKQIIFLNQHHKTDKINLEYKIRFAAYSSSEEDLPMYAFFKCFT